VTCFVSHFSHLETCYLNLRVCPCVIFLDTGIGASPYNVIMCTSLFSYVMDYNPSVMPVKAD
jgi:hypothetical protein